MYKGLPEKQGLYNPKFEHDNCGIGFLANIKGKKSHNIITDAIKLLNKLNHRGGVGSEPDSGDGAGILLQIPHDFMVKVTNLEGFNLPKEGDYGVGMLFLSQNDKIKTKSLEKLTNIINEEGQELIGIRKVPVFGELIGQTARDSSPYICQVFIKKSDSVNSGDDFERKLFIILKRAEKEIRYSKEIEDKYFYFASLSSRTIVYKGMLTPEQVDKYYIDLMDMDMTSALALVHSRFSTNTFPSWERAHPNRYIIHNGEINTIRGNVNWVKAREKMFSSDVFGEEFKKVTPVINEDGSDSSMLDNYIQLLSLSGYSLPQAIMMAIPESWENNTNMDENKRAFYEYNSCSGEAWDGPAAVGFSNGLCIGVTLDRNGLRPGRYYVTSDDMIIFSSEVGVIDVPVDKIIKKDRLHPGKMLLVDIENGKIIEDEELKINISNIKPYKEWIKNNLLNLDDIDFKNTSKSIKTDVTLLSKQKTFGYSAEDIDLTLKGIIETGDDPITAMGMDSPLAILSKKNQLLYNYFKQLFAQVTNPPIDAIREQIVTSTIVYLSGEENLLNPSEKNCRRIRCSTPILSLDEMNKIKGLSEKGFKTETISIIHDLNSNKSMEQSIEEIFVKADELIEKGTKILILSDLGVTKEKMPIPAILVSSGLHHHLIKNGTRMKVSIVVESGEPREVHHFAVLIGYGANAVCPYLAYESIVGMEERNLLKDVSVEDATKIYIKAVTKGIVKIMSKMGISTVQSYQGAQIFEALGISENVVNKYFTHTSTRIGGLEIEHIYKEALERHELAFNEETIDDKLELMGIYKYKKNGEYHMYNPSTISKLQEACREGNYELYKEYAEIMNNHEDGYCTLRSILDIRFKDKPIDIHEVESVENIVKRFKTGAMSYGSISQEVHECIAIAMNRLGGKSNSGEGGEIPERFVPDENGDSRCSAIKQVASGRFGVSIHYLQNAIEIQIKMAQGAKPGEGGHLPGKKVYPWIAKARNSTPGVELISPPPHHDIYSIEDLAQLIYDLKNANPNARISVKLVSGTGVGTIAVGVAKSRADVILISGYDGGTGAAPRTSIRHAGVPWELGLAETHQTLLMNNLRSRVVLETDGKLLTGRDVAIAALLGAEEYGFATVVLVVIGCLMIRICNLDTCPVGVATQNPELRKKFKGKPEYIENFMRFIAQDLRELMAQMGVKTINEMIGHTEKLKVKEVNNWKAKLVDLSNLLYQPSMAKNDTDRYFNMPQEHEIEKSFDYTVLTKLCKPAILDGKKIKAKFSINNEMRVIGTILSGEIVKVKGIEGLPDESIHLDFIGSAGQSFGAFLAPGVTLHLQGDANDHVGKGISGGKIIVVPPKNSNFDADKNVIVGNVALFGGVKGEAYINGIAGERFAVRNSGVTTVVEGVGDHALEYMTGGRVAIIGSFGRNIGAGMSGGIGYIYDENNLIETMANTNLIFIEKLNNEDLLELKTMIENHLGYTGSKKAKFILDNWIGETNKFVKIIPKAYKAVMEEIQNCKKSGASHEEALMLAFEKISGKVK